MPVIIPFTFVGGAGNKAKASEVNANFAILAAKFSGGIIAADIAAGAGIKGSGANNQLSTLPGERVGILSIEDEAVGSDQLAHVDTDSSGDDAGRAVSGYHIKTITPAHVDRVVPDNVLALDKLKITLATGGTDGSSTAISFTLTGGIPASKVLTLSGTFPKATYDCLGIFVKNGGGTAAATTGATLFVNDSGANWAASINVFSAGGGTFTGTAIVVFIQKSTT